MTGKIKINKSIVRALLLYGGLIWLIFIIAIIPHFGDMMALHDPGNFGISKYTISDTLYFAWRFPLTYLVFSLIHTKWSVVVPVVWYYSMLAISLLEVVVDLIRGDFFVAGVILIDSLAFGAAIYFFSLVTLRIIHNNMFIKSDNYLVRWFGALKMSLGEYWQWLLGSYVLYLVVNLFAD
ncbi:hypothetical protein [Lentilactobacillus sunkii]|uniref:Uncharacterized protein n=1 Tax=Lentilactobacillus sunkii DSM 19904 TaxID=1423808 RepID=A0A0R1KU99_9LACO|nr:hypothetical protein [Lentilactobacillus sunkii]KRK87004.1 hypothetical protein FD17_GL001535 [Lentilactobacillus sunkii DSM 19904]